MSLIAVYPGTCDYCLDKIEEGDEIEWSEDSESWVHADCLEDDDE